MSYRQFLLAIPVLLFLCNGAGAQPVGEANEPSPEELDAAFTEEDAAREAAAWSDVVIDRSRPDPLTAMTASADLVIRGTVVSQDYVYDEKGRPFTHTTLAISEVLKGSHTAPEVTIVQEGGPAKDNPENVVMVSDAHYFNKGEDELLFLETNPGEGLLRRVLIEQRFRIYNGKVYDENGRGVLLEANDSRESYRLAMSRNRNPAPRFSQIHIGPHTLTKKFGPQDGTPDSGGGEPQRESDMPGYRSSVNVSDFSAAIRDSKRGET